MGTSDGNDFRSSAPPVEVLDVEFHPVGGYQPPSLNFKRPFPWLPLVLFALTLISTLAVGVEFSRSYANGVTPYSDDPTLVELMVQPLLHPRMLLLGIPFSLTLLGILMAHEMGHFFACRYYEIDVSYPYFLPFPNPFGTFGAFIRIRSPITTRRALFDIGIAGPIAGFVVAVPAAAYSIAVSKIVPSVQSDASIGFGTPLVVNWLIQIFHPGTDPGMVLLSPVGYAAWFGLFATALNLLPMWQLDGGHIVYSITAERHQQISLAVSLVLIGLGIAYWHAWAFWGFVLLILALRFKHPPVLDRWETLNAGRKLLAIAALAIFALCFMLMPTNNVF